MLEKLIDLSLRHRVAVLLGVGALIAGGIFALSHLDIDAFPDTTPVMVQVNTTAPALGPEEIERQITYPIEQSLSGLPALENIRSVSKFGFSQVVVTFEDDTDIYFGRQVVGERLATVELPLGVGRPEMGPVATGLGEVFHYVLTYPDVDFTKLPPDERTRLLTQLRTTQDWVVAPQLRTVAGTAEINSWGGYEKQFQVRIDPSGLVSRGLTFAEVITALQQNNRNVGGGNIDRMGEMLLVQGLGRTVDLEQIGNIVIRSVDGVPVRIRDVATVDIGHEIRRGAVSADGHGEAVMGLGFMLMGENTHQYTAALKQKVDEIRANLPAGMAMITMYDRTELVDSVIDTVRKNLFEGGLLVVAVLFVFLGNLRAGLIVGLAIPLSMLFAFTGMWRFGIAASLLSLGALDFGLVVDSSVVMIENCVRHLSEANPLGRSRLERIRDAAVEVRGPTMFGELIIMIVYLPILTLEGVEGKMFRPMALTVIFALAGSMVLSMTLMPVLASLLLPKKLSHREPLLVRGLKRIYRPILQFTMHQRLAVIGFALCVLVFAFGLIAPNLGTEFMPQLSEGAVAINVVRLAGTEVDDSIRFNTQMERALLERFPDEIAHVWSRIGAAEIATDPMGLELTDIFITLRPRNQWQQASTQAELTRLFEETLRDLPGQRLAYTQPIKLRMDEMGTGSRADIAVKLYGDDLDVLAGKAAEIERVLLSVEGSADVGATQLTGQPMLQIKIRQDEIARYGVPASAVLDLVEAIGNRPVGDVFQGQLRFPLTVRLPDKYRGDVEAIAAVPVTTPRGEQIPLERLADVQYATGPSQIAREWGQRRVTVSVNVRGRDVGSFVTEAQQRIAEQVTMPSSRYYVEFGGQFEHMIRARQRLLIVVPVALVLIFSLLYITYGNLVDSVRVFTGIPFAWTGGIIALWLRDMPFSISAAVGFVALSGVAVLDDMLLVSTIRGLRNRGLDLEDAVEQAALTRLRPVLMTTLVAALGFVPMALSTGMGAEVQRPLATVVIGGVISAMVMSLLVLRVLYMVFQNPFRTASTAPADHGSDAAIATVARSEPGDTTPVAAGSNRGDNQFF
ncbi:efflux RND transporter permease subunit [Roseiconus nitratireducens]|uniref:Efflux RND transporter permease subunit n=1 Tax=Roseiconus nitratireducens TaxID=2605748 RepID=A0A5M6DIA6_9BACT|nr:CusA/CzcA family heavy metal efflux RND transporter [Roseiconus nitratireducens]KAA5547221.1 efflux RND transporter permease subunit [Roseiconus nitratireducens]